MKSLLLFLKTNMPTKKIIVTAGLFLTVVPIFFFIGIVSADDTPPAVTQGVSTIYNSQRVVQSLEPLVISNKALTKSTQHYICDNFPKYCTKEYLDPLGVLTDENLQEFFPQG